MRSPARGCPSSLIEWLPKLHGVSSLALIAPGIQAPRLALLSPDEVGPMDPFYDESRPCFQWSYHSSYLQVGGGLFTRASGEGTGVILPFVARA